jgi:FAD dependent oxidoreductase TIGR03364
VASPSCDLLVVGAGIVGLAHAVEAVRRGLSVTVVDRDARAAGASVRNFGHVGVTGQAGPTLDLALAARRRWLELQAAGADMGVQECGAVVVARTPEEMAVLEAFAAGRGSDEVRLLDAAGVGRAAPVGADEVVGGALLPQDLRVDQRRAIAALAWWLFGRPGVEIRWTTSFLGFDLGGDYALTSRGPILARRTVVCVGHDVDRLFTATAAEAGLRRCRLHMLRVAAPGGRRFAPAVLSGTSLLRYPAFARAAAPEVDALRRQVTGSQPELLEAGINLMLTQLPDGDLTIGDTHAYADTHPPFAPEALDDLVLREAARLLGADRPAVRERWRGTYADAPGDVLVATPAPGARVVSVTSGIGMTIALGLAPTVLDDLLEDRLEDRPDPRQ